jgi:four helix bundle protein
MANKEKQKFDLEERTLIFAKNCIDLCRLFLKDIVNRELIVQLIRASSSVGANYREVNDTITKNDFYHRINICRREAKESKYWLQLLLYANKDFAEKLSPLIEESLQLTKIFASISKKR